MSLQPIQRTIATFLPALIDLVLFPPSPTSPSLPPSPTTTPVSKLHQSYQVNMQPGYPETLYLDHSRLLLLTADAADITANAMFLAVYRQLVFSASAKTGKRAAPMSDEQLTSLKHEIMAVGASRPGLCFCKGYALEKGEHEQEPVQVVQWRSGMHATALHVAHAVETAEREEVPDTTDGQSSSARFRPPNGELLDSVTNWCATHMRPDTAVSTVFRKKIAAALLKQLIPRFFALWNAGVQQRVGSTNFFSTTTLPSESSSGVYSETPKPKTGLESLEEEIRLLADRLAKLAVLHLHVFYSIYDQSGIFAASLNDTLHAHLSVTDSELDSHVCATRHDHNTR